MTREFLRPPSMEGVFGPEIILNTASGDGCFRFGDGTIVGKMPEGSGTNAFLVWLGFLAVVVSEGVRPADIANVAKKLRELLELPDVPVLVALGRTANEKCARVASDNPASLPARKLATAEVFVLVQCAWDERERVPVEMDGQKFEFQVSFQQDSEGQGVPVVE